MARTKQTARKCPYPNTTTPRTFNISALHKKPLTKWKTKAKYIFCIRLNCHVNSVLTDPRSSPEKRQKAFEWQQLIKDNLTLNEWYAVEHISFDAATTTTTQTTKPAKKQKRMDSSSSSSSSSDDEELSPRGEGGFPGDTSTTTTSKRKRKESGEAGRGVPMFLKKAMQKIDYVDDQIEAGDGRLLQQPNNTIYTPVRSFLHISLMEAEQSLELHPWAQILHWFDTSCNFSAKYGIGGFYDYIESAFTPMQRVDAPLFSLQLVYNASARSSTFSLPYIMLTSKCTGMTTRFFPYSGENIPLTFQNANMSNRLYSLVCSTDSESELSELKDAISKLEHTSSVPNSDNNDAELEAATLQFKSTLKQVGYGGYMTENGLIYMPVYSNTKFNKIKRDKQVLDNHPWMKFLVWYTNFLKGENADDDDNETLLIRLKEDPFNLLQRLDADLYSVQFVYNMDSSKELSCVPYVLVTDKTRGCVYYFYIYGDGECIEDNAGKSIHFFQQAVDPKRIKADATDDDDNETKKINAEFHKLCNLIRKIES